MSEKEHQEHHLKLDFTTMKKKIDYLTSLFNKQTDYFDQQMHKNSIKYENLQNLEKRL